MKKSKSLLTIVFCCLIFNVPKSVAQDFNGVIEIIDEMEKPLNGMIANELAVEKSDYLTNSTQASDSSEVLDNPSNLFFNFGMDLVSRYIWRGVEFGVSTENASTPHLQPTASLSYDFGTSGTVSLGVWGSYGIDGSYNENDFYFNYSVSSEIGSFSITFDDYYYPFYEIPFTNFEGDGLGAHTIDAQISYTFPEKFPLSILFSTNIHNDVPDNKSIYIEASYSFTISDIRLNLFAGAAQGESIWHGVATEEFEFINVGFKAEKSIKITQDYSLPVGVSWIYNHYLEKTYLVFKVSF